jgi:uncharacterized protein involved in outer membrane biogenesis
LLPEILPLKKISIISAALLLSLILPFALLSSLLADPDKYQEEITDILESATDYQIRLENIQWQLWPSFSMLLNGISIAANDSQPPFAKVSLLSLELTVLPFLTDGKLNLSNIIAEQVNLNLITDSSGQANWALSKSDQGSQISKTKSTSSVRWNSIAVHDLTVHYMDKQSNQDFLLTASMIAAQSMTSGPASTHTTRILLKDNIKDTLVKAELTSLLQFTEDPAGLRFSRLNGQIKVDYPASQRRLINLDLTGWLMDNFNRLQLDLSSIGSNEGQLSFKGAVNNLQTNPQFDLGIQLQVASLNSTTKQTGKNPAQAGYVPEIEFQGQLTGDPTRLTLPDLSGHIDQQPLTANIQWINGDTPKLHANIKLKQWDLSKQTRSETESPTATVTPLNDFQILPVNLLRKSDILLSVRADQIKLPGYALNDLIIRAGNQDDNMLAQVSFNTLGGNVKASLNSNYQQQTKSYLTLNLKQIDLPSVTDKRSIGGSLNANGNYQFTGSRLSDLQTSLTGATTAKIDHGTVNVTSLKNLSTAIDLITGKSTHISHWPDQVPFDRFDIQHQFREGTVSEQQFTGQIANLKFSGKGGFDLFKNNINYQLKVNLDPSNKSPFSVSGLLTEVDWPMQCIGSLGNSITTLCEANQSLLGDIISTLAKKELRLIGRENLEKHLGNNQGSLKKIFKGLFKSE